MSCLFFRGLLALPLKLSLAAFALALFGCDFPWDEGEAKPKPVPIPGPGTPHAPPPAEGQTGLNCVWNFSGPRNFPCQWGAVCTGSVSCQPAGPFFQVAVCRQQLCSDAGACLADRSYEAQACSQQLGGQINLAFPRSNPAANPAKPPREGR